MMDYITAKEMSEYSKLPISKKLYPNLGYSFWRLVVDEADNTDIINYCNINNILYYIHVDKEQPKELLLLSLVRESKYVNLKQKFPDIKEIEIEPKSTMEDITQNIPEFYEGIDAKECYAFVIVPDNIATPDILKFFAHSYTTFKRNGYKYSYCLLVPDIESYKKLVLILGGCDRIILRQLVKVE